MALYFPPNSGGLDSRPASVDSGMASRAGRMRPLCLLNDLDPQVKCEVLSLGDTQVGPHLALVALSEHRHVQRHRRGQILDVTAITIRVARQLGQHQVVWVER